MAITADKVLEDACQMYRELCQAWLSKREADWPQICREKSEVDLAKGVVVLRSAENRYLRRYHFRHDDPHEYSMWEPELCRECQQPILDCYMAKEELWQQAGYRPLDLVCPECLERKVGRPLVSRDFERIRRHQQVKRAWRVPGARLVSDLTTTVFGYFRKHILCQRRLTSWIHAGRLRLVRRLVEPYAGRKVLDYSSGDGTCLALVHDLDCEAVGADTDPKQIRECGRRFNEIPELSFVLRDELGEDRHKGKYELVLCREVLEHCLEETWDAILNDLTRLATPDGTIIISTPVEIGPSLIFKEIGRTVTGWRGLGPETYTIAQFWKMVFAGARTSIDRPIYRGEFAPEKWKRFHGHKGFNWRKLRARLSDRLTVERICFWPLGWSGGYLSSQAWFICKQRPSELP
jgi:2-polyprenyl-3-methyl-5-hydroxy-6-metoxy-1,4-benzoquinol methylase